MADTAAAARPLPRFPEPDTEAFWAATRERRLTYQACRNCGTVIWHPRAHCTGCLDGELEWRECAGLGTVYTFTVIRQAGHPYFRGRLPYVVAYVDLDEGFRMLTELVGVEPEAVAVGQRVQVDWEEHDEVNVPLFRPVA